jgi:hypothetical protein
METPSIFATGSTSPFACPACSGPVDVKSRHVVVAGSAVRVYCSEDCLQAQTSPRLLMPTIDVPDDPPRLWLHMLGIFVGLVLLAVLRGTPVDAPRAPIALSLTPTVTTPVIPPGPPPDVVARQAVQLALQMQETSMVAGLMQETWFHPLAGPKRRMPQNHTQAFGAERPGDRPIQCLSGHCGVDVGGGLWGEPVRAVHEGVVDHVDRGPNEERGGLFVRISHSGGMVYSWYFHLAAIPRWIQPGTHVEAGQVIGLVGDTGVKQSAPHLHFAMTVKPTPDGPERYLDPEALLAIWPLWIPDQDGATGLTHVSTRAPPGVPVRGPQRPKKDVAQASHTAADAPAPAPSDPAAPPAVAPAP